MTRPVFEATVPEEVRAAILDARRDRVPLEIRGGGSVLDRLPPGDGVVLSVGSMTGVVAHAAQDLTVTVRAGTRFDDLARLLADAGQECPIEPSAGAGSTVGGRVATGLAGPRQLGAGRVRDQVLRIRFVDGAGRMATAGGVTVKDVTGYDLCRLLTGSWGTLGVVTEVTLKLRPLARSRAWYATRGTRDPSQPLDRLLYRPVAEVATAGRTHVLLEGHPDDVVDQARSVGLEPADPPLLPTVARASVDPARLSELVPALQSAGCHWAAQVGVGVCHLDGAREQLTGARQAAERLGGSLLVLDPASGLPAFGGPPPDPMAARVRAALDPDRVLAPWRWHA